MTSRTAFERGKEHLRKLIGCAQDSPLYKHTEEVHLGKEVYFKMKTIKKHFTALDRSLHEAVRIRRQSNNPTMISLNSRAEFGFSSLSRLTISYNDVPNMMINNLMTPYRMFLSLERARKEHLRKESLILKMIKAFRNLNTSLLLKFQNISFQKITLQICHLLTNQMWGGRIRSRLN